MPRPTSITKSTNTEPKLTAVVFDVTGKELRSIELATGLFGISTNDTLVSEVVVSAQANRRHAIANTLRRGEVRGGGKKPWRQKGTGRARQGSTRAPHWRHGGVAFGPTSERNFSRKINKQARETVIRMLLSSLHESDQVRLIDGLTFSSTKQAAQFLNVNASSARRPLLLTATADAQLLRNARNLDGVMVRSMERLGLLDLVLTDQLVLDIKALAPLTTRYGSKSREARVESGENTKTRTKDSTLNPASPTGRSQLSTLASKQKKARSTSKSAGQESHV